MQMCWLVPDLERRHRRLGPLRRCRPLLLVRRRRRHRRSTPRRAGRVPHESRPPSPTPATCRSSSSARTTTSPASSAICFARGHYGLHHMAVVCDDYEAERDAYIASRRRARLRGTDRWPQPHVLGRHLAHPGVHGRAAGAERDARQADSPPCGPPPSRGTAQTRSPASDVDEHRHRRSRSCSPTVVARAGDHPALIVADETLTYAELDRRSARMARALLASGAGKGTRIGLLAPDGTLLPDHLLRRPAHRRAGHADQHPDDSARAGAHHPDQRRPDPRSASVASFVVTSPTNLEAALPGLADAGSGAAPARRARRISGPSGSTTPTAWPGPVRSTICSHAPTPRTRPDDALLAAVEREVSPADDAFVVYTSGSTASPKAVVARTVGGRPTKPQALAPIFLMTSEDRTLPLLPAFWMGGIAAALQVLSTGGTLVYPPSPDIDDVLDTIERHDITYVVVWHKLAKLRAAAKARGIDVGPHPRASGRRPRDEHGELDPRAPDGPTCSGCRRASPPTAPSRSTGACPSDKAGASGRAVNGIERRVVDPETGEEVPPGEVGELQLRGGGLDDRLLQGRPAAGVHARRLLPDQGSRPDRCRRLRLLRRSHRRHDQDQLGQRVAARGRSRAERAAGRRRYRWSRACPTPSSARWSPRPWSRHRAPTRPRTSLQAALRDRISQLQDPPPHRVHHRTTTSRDRRPARCSSSTWPI